MTQSEELREQLRTLKGRKKEYQAKRQAASAVEKPGIDLKIKGLQGAIHSVQEQLDHLEPPGEKKRRAQGSRRNVAGVSFDWFERNKVAWADVDGHSWAQAEAGELGGETGADQAREWLAQAAQRLTPMQAVYLDAYYNRGLSLAKIAQEHGVDPSSVHRGIQRGLRRMREWIEAKQRIAQCRSGPEEFQLAEYIAGAPVITPRQRELMLVVLSGAPRTQTEIAGKLDLAPNTVSRTLGRGGHTLKDLGLPRAADLGERPALDWEAADKYTLPVQLGLGLGFAYRYSNERVEGMTRYNWELRRRLLAGQSAQETAEELQLSVRVVRDAYRRLERGMQDDRT